VTVPELLQAHPEGDLILKIDIEGDEWPVLDAMPSSAFARFAQITGEFHFFSEIVLNEDQYQRARRVLDKLDRHFCVIHNHATNGHPILNVAGVLVPSLMEITFASRARYQFKPSTECFPTPLDAPNHPHLPEIHTGGFRY
jgi:hypothetical protein